MAILHGRNMIVKADGVVIACARSCELSIESEMIEVASPSSGIWKKYTNGRKSWSVALGSLVSIPTGTKTGNIRQALNMVGKTVTLSMECTDPSLSTSVEYVGTAVCIKSQITAVISNLAQGSFQFQGNGELYDNSDTDIYCEGILLKGTGGTNDGYYLVRSGYTASSSITTLVLNDLTAGTLIQTELTPKTDVNYHVGEDTYIWDGISFAKVVPESLSF